MVHAVFDEMPLLLAALDGPEHVYVAANAAYRAFVGRERLVGRAIRDVLPELAGQQIFEMFERVYATGRAQTAREWRAQIDRHGTGVLEEFYADYTVTPRRGPDGEVVGVLVSAVDVTERVLQRRATEQLAADAERRGSDARDVVTALQEALLPTALPVLPGARVAGRYLVAAEDQTAGGDWFDVIPLAGGRVALVAGDVVGHGVAASAAMGQLRAVLKHVLATEPSLSAALGQVDGFARSEPALRAATLAVAVLDPATGHLSYATCGHPPPLVVSPDGDTRYLPITGSGPLGTGSALEIAAGALSPGETMLLYSDGLVERPGRTIAEGMAELATVAGDSAAGRALPVGAASSRPERVCQLSVELLTGTGYADDVTALAVERTGGQVADLDLDLEAEPVSVPGARRAL